MQFLNNGLSLLKTFNIAIFDFQLKTIFAIENAILESIVKRIEHLLQISDRSLLFLQLPLNALTFIRIITFLNVLNTLSIRFIDSLTVIVVV